MIPVDLPQPDHQQEAHSARLQAMISAELAANQGWLSFERYMDLVLYAPGLGYYSAGSAKLGQAGDFVTAPELSPVFGCCAADALAGVLSELGGGSVLELGAGTGRLAFDVLCELHRRDCLPQSYEILEISADLRERQQRCLAQLPASIRDRVIWRDRLPDSGFCGVILANEVADALPVQRFSRLESSVMELGVIATAQGFGWSPRPASDALCLAVDAIEQARGERLPEGFVSEVSLLAPRWITSLAQSLQRGAVFLIDYGLPRVEYYNDQRDDGTLACFYRHRLHADPFVLLGLQDVTAWVDFTGLAEAGTQAGLDVAGYTSQAHFLMDTGFDSALARHLKHADPLKSLSLRQAALTLVLPGEMGERFKCLALSKGVEVPRGFRLRDFSSRL